MVEYVLQERERIGIMQNSTMNVTAATKKCPYCGSDVAQSAQKCSKCGEWLVTRYGNSWVKTLLLCMFLGLVGGHNFYNKKSGIAIGQIFTFFGVCGIWPAIDCIMILCDAYRDGDGLKLSRKPTKGGTAALCALGFLGFAGAHRFYTKDICLAWLQCFTLGGCLVWTLLDFILILSGKFKDADGNYIK